jgi:hypothetical protein
MACSFQTPRLPHNVSYFASGFDLGKKMRYHLKDRGSERKEVPHGTKIDDKEFAAGF